MDKFEPGVEYPGLSGNRVKITYGNQCLENIFQALIELEIEAAGNSQENTKQNE